MSLNKVILIGNVGRDPEVRYFDSGAAVANFPLATSERGYTLANGTVVPERTEWHNVVVRRDLVSFVEKWVKKGSGLYVEGKIRTRSYDDQSGVKRYVTEIPCRPCRILQHRFRYGKSRQCFRYRNDGGTASDRPAVHRIPAGDGLPATRIRTTGHIFRFQQCGRPSVLILFN